MLPAPRREEEEGDLVETAVEDTTAEETDTAMVGAVVEAGDTVRR